jgi:hypothetical protein
MPILAPLREFSVAAPVSHHKRPGQSAANAVEFKRKGCKISKADRYSPAHNGLAAGSSPAGLSSFLGLTDDSPTDQRSGTATIVQRFPIVLLAQEPTARGHGKCGPGCTIRFISTAAAD